MGQTNRKYPTRAVVVRVRNSRALSSGHERGQEGDIIGFCKIGRPAIGLSEAHEFLWLHLDGLDDLRFDRLKDPLTDPLVTDSVDFIQYDKRRYCVPFDRLKVVAPFIDLARVRDVDDDYQPFLNIDKDDDQPLKYQHYILTTPRSLRIEGLVFDKALGKFL